MAEDRSDDARRQRPTLDVPPSVLHVLSSRLGEAPRVSLREEGSGAVGAPPIDPRSEERAALPEGRGSYQVLGEIARGGMGVVLRSHDTDLGRDVAMKVLSKELAGRPEVVQRFVEEAQIGGQLQHPGIVPVYELGLMADERPYFTMKLVKGRTLATLLAERESTEADRRKLIDVFESVCQTMAYAHSRGVIHRDLKPANVMVGAFGEVQVVDWGLAKVLARGGVEDERRVKEVRTELTVLETVRSEGSAHGSDSLVGSVMGTPSYMPPEQASGRVDRLDERADVFALGAILCEIVTGAPPYPSSQPGTLQRAAAADLDEAFERLDACAADPELVKLAKACLVPAPAARLRNAGVLAEQVQRYLEGQEERARAAQVEAAEARVRATQERKARRLTLALAASVLVTLIVGGGGWVWVERQRAERAAAELERERALAAEVSEVLDEARLAAARERWEDATDAAARARAMALAGDAPAALVAEVDVFASELAAAVDEAEREAARARDTARLLEELDGAANSLEFDPSMDPAEREARQFALYPGIFAEHGIDVDGTPPAALAAELSSRGLGAEIAMTFDMWAAARRSAKDEEGALHLLEVAHLVDPDLLRADLREAVANGDLEMLRTLAAEDERELQPATLELLAVSLRRLGDRDEALEVLARATASHPTAPRLHALAAQLLAPGLVTLGTPEARLKGQRALGHAWAAVALRPNAAADRFLLGTLLLRLGRPDVGRRALEEAARSDIGSRYGGLLLGFALSDIEGAEEESLALARAAQEGPPTRVMWATMLEAKLLRLRGDRDGAIEAQRRALAGASRGRTFMELLGRLHEAGDAHLAEHFLWGYAEGGGLSDNTIAWYLANARVGPAADPAFARALAEEAVALAEGETTRAPSAASLWNTLALARLRAGDLVGAREAAERSVALSEAGGYPTDWFALAVIHHGLGDEALARLWFERGRPFVDGTVDVWTSLEDARLAEEAAARLGLALRLPNAPR